MRTILFAIVLCVLLASCGEETAKQAQPNSNTPAPTSTPAEVSQSNRQSGPSQTPPPNTQHLKVFITEPQEGATVTAKPFVTGTVDDPSARVWVVVHPTELGDYWVQQPTSPKDDKTWRVQIYVGEPNTPAGTHFEIRAVANPKAQLSAGQVLDRWPDGQWLSQVVEVVR